MRPTLNVFFDVIIVHLLTEDYRIVLDFEFVIVVVVVVVVVVVIA